MKRLSRGGMVLLAAGMMCGCASDGVVGGNGAWVGEGTGKLVYRETERGDRVMDFSYAGYKGGGVGLPVVEVQKAVDADRAGTGDDTARIQEMVDAVGSLAMKEGVRGAVLLGPGMFRCAGTIELGKSGVVLRGSGSGGANDGGTTIWMSGKKHVAIEIGTKERTERGRASAGAAVTDAYVPEGTRSFSVADGAGLKAGDAVEIRRPVTKAWVHFMGMDTMVRDGKKETWIGEGREEVMRRTVTAVAGNRVTVDVPLADSLDAALLSPPGTRVVKVDADAGRVENVGVEELRIQCAPVETSFVDAAYSGIRVGGDDCWVRDVACVETMNTMALAGRRITVEGVSVMHTFENLGASKPADFSIEGSQILVDRCNVTGDNEYFVWTSALQAGPNVVLGSTFRGRGSRLQPHQRWSTGLLFDNCVVPDGGIDFSNRGVAGSGHGWTMGWGVAWNCVAKTFIIQKPPGVENWEIGCVGERVREPRYFDSGPVLEEGAVESAGRPVAPASLYLAQLKERVGREPLVLMGYPVNSLEAFPGRKTEKLEAWKGAVDPELGVDLAFHRPLAVSSFKAGATGGREFAGEKAVDDDARTYWTTEKGGEGIMLEMDMEGPVDVNAVVLTEAAGFEGRVQHYQVEGQVDSDWKVLAEGTAIGGRKVERFEKATVWKVKVTLSAKEPPGISGIGVYCVK